MSAVEATQQPFNVRFQIDQAQFFIAQGCKRITALRAITSNPVGIEENHCGGIPAVAPVLPVLIYRVFDDPKTISSTTDANIEMDMETGLFAQVAQPLRKGSFALALGAYEDAPSPGNCSAPCHLPSPEGGQTAHRAASVLLLKVATTPQPGDITRTVNLGDAIGTFLNDESFLFFEAVQNGQVVERAN